MPTIHGAVNLRLNSKRVGHFIVMVVLFDNLGRCAANEHDDGDNDACEYAGRPYEPEEYCRPVDAVSQEPPQRAVRLCELFHNHYCFKKFATRTVQTECRVKLACYAEVQPVLAMLFINHIAKLRQNRQT
jgi:hypothetical protein